MPTLKELKKDAKDRGLKGFSTMKKAALEKLLLADDNNKAPKVNMTKKRQQEVDGEKKSPSKRSRPIFDDSDEEDAYYVRQKEEVRRTRERMDAKQKKLDDKAKAENPRRRGRGGKDLTPEEHAIWWADHSRKVQIVKEEKKINDALSIEELRGKAKARGIKSVSNMKRETLNNLFRLDALGSLPKAKMTKKRQQEASTGTAKQSVDKNALRKQKLEEKRRADIAAANAKEAAVTSTLNTTKKAPRISPAFQKTSATTTRVETEKQKRHRELLEERQAERAEAASAKASRGGRSLKVLRAEAKKRGFKGYSSMKKATLEAMLAGKSPMEETPAEAAIREREWREFLVKKWGDDEDEIESAFKTMQDVWKKRQTQRVPKKRAPVESEAQREARWKREAEAIYGVGTSDSEVHVRKIRKNFLQTEENLKRERKAKNAAARARRARKKPSTSTALVLSNGGEGRSASQLVLEERVKAIDGMKRKQAMKVVKMIKKRNCGAFDNLSSKTLGELRAILKSQLSRPVIEVD